MERRGTGLLTEADIKRGILKTGKRIYELGYIAATDGNISYKLRDRIYITASGVGKGDLKSEDILAVNLEGKVVSGKGKPTSELPMHLAVYKLRGDVSAVIHAHPPYATALSLAGVSLPDCILPEVVLSLGKIPVARYATPSSEKGADVISELISNYDAIILDRHGTLTVGKNLSEAFFKLDRIEHSAKVTAVARQLGEISPLPKEEVDRLIEIAESMGIRSGKPECTTCNACGGNTNASKPDNKDRIDDKRLSEIVSKTVMEEIRKMK